MNIEHYKNWFSEPWGKLQYQLIFSQLANFKGLKVLDFGSGLGVTAHFLAQNNDVIAIEKSKEMIENRLYQSSFTQLQGSLDILQNLPEEHFDLITCHNVLEYIKQDEHDCYLQAFRRILKKDGLLSIIKHHDVGKVIHKVVFENKITEAQALLEGKDNYQSPSFSEGHTYSLPALTKRLGQDFKLEKLQGLRCLYALQPNEFKTKDGWLEDMVALELAICNQSPYKDIAFFQHAQFRKNHH